MSSQHSATSLAPPLPAVTPPKPGFLPRLERSFRHPCILEQTRRLPRRRSKSVRSPPLRRIRPRTISKRHRPHRIDRDHRAFLANAQGNPRPRIPPAPIHLASRGEGRAFSLLLRDAPSPPGAGRSDSGRDLLPSRAAGYRRGTVNASTRLALRHGRAGHAPLRRRLARRRATHALPHPDRQSRVTPSISPRTSWRAITRGLSIHADSRPIRTPDPISTVPRAECQRSSASRTARFWASAIPIGALHSRPINNLSTEPGEPHYTLQDTPVCTNYFRSYSAGERMLPVNLTPLSIRSLADGPT